MRIVFVGATDLTIATAQLLIEQGNEVVIIECDKDRIDELEESLDCSFLHGDGTKPQILREAGPEHTDVLFCLTDHAQTNIIASLVGRSTGYERVITSIDDPEFEGVCRELGLEGTIVPSRTISRYLADIVRGVDVLELSTIMKGSARFFSFTAGSDDAGSVADLGLPDGARVICFYREGEFHFAEDDISIAEDDEVIVLTHSRNIPDLRERWRPKTSAEEPVPAPRRRWKGAT